MRALKKNGSWEFVDLSLAKRPVGCKRVITMKHKLDRIAERSKRRVVAKGITQAYGLHYQETFAHVAKINSIQVLLSLVAI